MSKQTIIIAIGLLMLLTACEVPELNLVDATTGDPHSTFVEHRAIVRVNVGEPLPIESYHLSNTKIESLDVLINGQPIRSETTTGQMTFPSELVSVQVFGRPVSPDSILITPFYPCRIAQERGIRLTQNPVTLDFPSNTWSVCHLLTGQVPGLYELSIRAIDQTGQSGQTIVQRIEVE